MTAVGEGLHFILQRHTTQEGRETRYYIVSSIWQGISRIQGVIRDKIRWVPGYDSNVFFWTDNWLGYKIAEKINIPYDRWAAFNQRIIDFRDDNIWFIDPLFANTYPDIFKDIIAMNIAQNSSNLMVWPHHKSGRITSKGAYEFYRSTFPKVSWGVWIWDKFIPPARSTFIWRLIWTKVPTWDVLASWGIARLSC